MSWDNRKFDVNGTTAQLPAALKVAFAQDNNYAPMPKAVGWIVRDGALLLLSHLVEGSTAFPAPLCAEGIVPSVNGWLMEEWLSPRAPAEPDHDGSNGKGWRMFVEEWGRVSKIDCIVAIKPEWLSYGK